MDSCTAKPLLYCAIILWYFAIISCNPQKSPARQNAVIKKQSAITIGSKKKFIEPTVIRLTDRNYPAIIKAGKPVIKKDSIGLGIPFFTYYSTSQGLPVNNVICSAADNIGNLWFGTGGGGVSKYDGKNFKNYTTAQGLAGNVVFAIIEDKGGNIWIGTTAGASKYNGSYFINYTVSQGLAGNFVTSLLQDRSGNIWLGTHDGGVSKYDGKHFINYSTSQGLANNYVRCIMQDSKGNIWFGTDAGGASRYDGSHFTNYTQKQGLANNSINAITQDAAGNLWLGTNAGVSEYNFSTFRNYTTADGLADNNVYSICHDQNGSTWFGTHTKGVSKYDGRRFKNYSKNEGLADNKINSILQDKQGNVWISSQGGGISRYEGNSFTSYTTTQGLAGNLVFSIIQDKSNNLWFGTYEGGVSKYNGQQFENYSKAQGLPDISIWSMLSDRDGNIWFGSDRAGVSKYDGTNFTNYSTAQGLTGNAIISMMQDRDGNIWFGTRENGVSKFDGKSFTSYTMLQGLAGNNIQSIIQDSAGNIWFGTRGGGASKYDGSNFTNYTTAMGLVDNNISSLYPAKTGDVWLGTDGMGVSRYDGKKFTTYNTDHGLADNAVSFISEDKTRSILWFGTNQGLSGAREKLTSAETLMDISFENFSKITGHPMHDVSTGGMFADKTGILWAGSGEGRLIRFDYSALSKKNTKPLSISIQEIKINNSTICWNNLLRFQPKHLPSDSLSMLNEMVGSFGKVLTPAILDSMGKKYKTIKFQGITKFYPVPVHLVLPHQYNNITISFAAIAPAMPAQVKYQYKLENYNNEWSPPGNYFSAVFGNIPQGDYIFKLKALSPYGVWSETEYAFTVLPPWWFTWFAYALYALAASLLFYAFYINGKRKAERKQATQINIILGTQEEERERISRDLHDDIGARLTNINLLSALGQQKINDPEQISAHLLHLSDEVQNSVEALDDIVWSIDTQNDSTPEITARMRRYTAEVFDGTAIRYTINADENLLPAKLPASLRRNLFFVFKEAINNIQKHAMASVVTIDLTATANSLNMQVTDDGKGFDTNQSTQRNGLKNMQQRLQKCRGRLTVHSALGKGSLLKIEMSLPTPSLKKGIANWFKKQ